MNGILLDLKVRFTTKRPKSVYFRKVIFADLSDENLKTSKSSSQSYSIQLPQIMKKPVGGLNLSSPLTKQEETPESEREIFARKGRFRPGELSYFNGPDDVKRSLSLLLNLQVFRNT